MPFHLSRERAHLLAFGAILLAFLGLMFWLGSVLLPIGISVIAAYVLLPVAQFLERFMPWRRKRPDLARFVAVAVIFIAAHGAFIGVLLLLIPSIIEEGRQFARDFPEFLSGARVTIEGWVEQYVDTVPQDAREQIEMVLAEAGQIVGSAAFNMAQQTLGVVTGSFAFVLALATAPVLIFYLMKDASMITNSLQYPFPGDLRPHLHNLLRMADHTLGGYLRGQLILGLVVGTLAGVGLWSLGISAAPMLGVVAGLTELVPIIGPWIGGAVGVVVTLATDPDKVVWVILLYLIIQLMENTLLVPRIQAETLSLHPVVVILIITLGSQFFGLWGVVLGPPLTALGRDLIVYFYRHWNLAPSFDPDLISAAPDHHPIHPPHPLMPDGPSAGSDEG